MKIILAAAAVLSLFAVSSRAADAPKPADNTQKCADLQKSFDKDMKSHIFGQTRAKSTWKQMKQLNCPNLPPDPNQPKK